MRVFYTALVLVLTSIGQVVSQEPPSPPAVSIQDIDYQIKITKQYMEEYKNQAFLFDEKAQDLLSHDYMGYRDAEAMSQQSSTIANDLANHLAQLEKQRAEIIQRQSQNSTSDKK